MVNVTFKAKDIKKAKFVDLEKGWDDGDPLWSGLLQLTLKDGTKKEYRCGWIRSGHKIDIKTQNMEAVIEYLEMYDVKEIM